MNGNEAARGDLAARFETMAWGAVVFLIGVEFLPTGTDKAVLVAAAGALLLGVNAARVATGMAVSWFSTILGGVVLLVAVAHLAGRTLPGDAILLMAFGVAIVAGQLVRLARPAPAG